MRRKLPTLEPEAAGDRGLDEYVNFGKYRGYTVRTLLRDNRYVHWIISYPQGLEAALRSHGSDLWWHAFITALSPQQRHLLDLTRRKGATDRLQEAHEYLLGAEAEYRHAHGEEPPPRPSQQDIEDHAEFWQVVSRWSSVQ